MSDLFNPTGSLRPLRPHQSRAIDLLRKSFASGHRRPMLQAPTGFGKTLTVAHIIQRLVSSGKRVAFTVPKLSLIDQTVSAFEVDGIDVIGVVQAGHWRADASAPLQVCSIQTITRRKARPVVDFVIVDEAHELHKEIFGWMDERPDLRFIGLSATPWSRTIGKHYDDLIIAATTAELIEAGYLSKFIVFAPATPDLRNVRTVAGEFHQGELGDAVDKTEIVADVIQTWQARGENRPTLCYGVNRAHAEHIQQRFVEAGIAAEYVDGDTPREEREKIFERFRSGRTKIICNVGVLTTGVDFDVRCIIDAKPTRSEILYVQTIGRGLRTAPGKDKLIVLDHAGNALRLGLVDHIHHDRLDDGRERKSRRRRGARAEPLPRLCKECAAVLRARARVCDLCGHVREARTEIMHRDGELVAFGSGVRGAAPAIGDKARFFGELRWHAQTHGYAPGWAAHKFRERFGEWPNDWRVKTAPPQEPGLATRNWIMSRAIAFAKGRAHG